MANLQVKLSNIKHLVLSGGGLLGISYIGLLKYLEENNIRHQIESITSCSAGSIFGTLFMLDYSSQEIETLIKSLDFKQFLNINIDTILKFPQTKGLDSANKLTDFFKKIIKDKTGNENTTFEELYQKTNKILQIGTTNLTSVKFELFNYKTQPTIPIYLAIRASIAIPIIFEPVIIGNDVYCDGGVIDNLPMEGALSLAELICEISENNKGREKCLESILSVFLRSTFQPIYSNNLSTITIHHFIDIVSHAMNNGHILNNYRNKYLDQTLIIDIPVDIMTFLKISASHDDIDNIIQIAYDTSKQKLKL